jgi:hypothetical protein
VLPSPITKAVTLAVKRAAGALGIVVALAHGADQRERAEGERVQRRLGSASNHHVGVAAPQIMHRIAQRDGGRGARVAVGGRRALKAELDGDVARAGSGKDRKRQDRRHAAWPAFQVGRVLLLAEAHAAQRRSHAHAHAMRGDLRGR